MSERIAAGLRPDRQAMRFGSDSNRFHGAAGCVDCVNNLVETSGQPQKFAVRADVPHIGAAAAGNRPGLFYLLRGEINDRNAAWPVRFDVAHVGAAVRHIKFLAVTAGIKTVRPPARWKKSGLFEILSVDEEHAVCLHIRNEQKLSVRRDANVLRHAMRHSVLRSTLLCELQVSNNFAMQQINFDQSAPRKLASEERVEALDREIRMIHARTLR